MIEKNKFSEHIVMMKSISKRYQNTDFIYSLDQLININNTFNIKVLFVGQFNAGKSALLNGLLGRPDFLTEKQLPQTALATELIYDENERFLAVDTNNNKCSITDTQVDNPKNFSHIELFLNSETLNKTSDFTIVDTPGFDSDIDAHNKALSSYIGCGSAFIVLVDIEKGGIDKVSLNFIDEISEYTDQIVVILNKCDKQTEKNILEVKENAEATLMANGYNYPVFCVSKKDNNISDKLVEIINCFDAQQIFDLRVKKAIHSQALMMVNVLQIAQGRIFLDTYEMDDEIRKYKKLKESINETLVAQKKKMENEYENYVEKVIQNVRAALIAKADSVANAILSGGGEDAIIAETLRPVIVASVKSFASEQLEDIMREIDLSCVSQICDNQNLKDIISGITANAKNLIEDGTFEKATTVFQNKKEGEKEKKHKSQNVYKAITGVAAIATDVIAPWLEIIIVLLPDIISLLGKLFGESDESKVKRAYINSIIPQVTNKLYDPICSAVNDTYSYLLSILEETINEKMASVEQALEEAKQKKNTTVTEFGSYKKNLAEDINTLKKIIDKMEK